MIHARLPPGPRGPLIGGLINPGRDPLAFLTRLARTYGDVAYFRLGSERAFFINHPQHIRDVLVTHDRNFTKSRGLERAKKLLGEGLLTSEGAAHMRQRRLLQPAVHRDRIDALIAERRAAGHDRGDLLSMLLMAQDEEDGSGLSDRQVRDEAMTLILAGHETTANALAWTWYLVSQSLGVETRLHEEIDRVLQGRLPGAADLGALPFVEQVVTESMRLYPPAWVVGRRALADYAIGDFVVPARSVVFMSPYVMQRDSRYYADADRFLPERWTPDFKAALPKFAYLPFGGGPRQCIGEP